MYECMIHTKLNFKTGSQIVSDITQLTQLRELPQRGFKSRICCSLDGVYFIHVQQLRSYIPHTFLFLKENTHFTSYS